MRTLEAGSTGVVTDRLARRLVSARSLPWLAAFAVYLALAAWITWPVIANPTEDVFGYPGDSTGQISLLNYRQELGVGPLSSAVTPLENAPFGLPLPGANTLPQLAVEAPMQAVASVTDEEVLAFNIAVLLGLLLTPLAAHLLGRFVTGSHLAGLIAGLAYGFNPWHIERAQGHVHLTHLEALPLVLLALLWIRRSGGRKAWLLLAGSVALGAYTHTYFALFLGALLVGFCLMDIGWTWWARKGGTLVAVKRTAGAFGVLVAVYLPQAIWYASKSDEIGSSLTATRGSEDLFTYGSRWFEWLVPSFRHPVFDAVTGDFLFARLHGSNFAETSIYVGWSVLLLAAIGLVAAARNRGDRESRFAAAAAGAVAVAGFVTSLPKEVSPFGFRIPTPSAAISIVFDDWRAYSRLFVVVQLGLVVLAALGIAWLLRRMPGPARVLVTAPIAALVVFDLSSSADTFRLGTPPAYAVVAELGRGSRAEFPVTSPLSADHLTYIAYTELSGHPLFNGGKPRTWQASVQGRLQNIEAPFIAPTLAAFGVRWLVVNDFIYRRNNGYRPPDTLRGLTLIHRDPDRRVFRVESSPPSVIGVPGDGFDQAEFENGGYAQWLLGSSGTIALFNRTDRPVPVSVELPASSFAVDRTVLIARDGNTVLRAKVGTNPRPIRFQTVAAPGVSKLDVSSPEPPTSIAETLHIPDPRVVSLRLGGLTVRPRGGAPFRLG
jgi:hypothetical protein